VPSASEDYVFVYGTLRADSGHPMNRTLEALGGRVGRGRVPGILYDLGSYPGAVETAETGAFLHGEVYLLRDPGSDLETLDRYEGLDEKSRESGEFRRSRIVVDLSDGRTVEAWIYLYNRPTAGLARIRSGDYLASRKE
jgi:gamma-glutamylcyclotransferase (GGCT)/AIG2-like uncharacterized protein YtfP